MDWNLQDNAEPKLVVVNATPLAAFNEENCKYCGRYGCTDRGYTLTVGDPPVTIGEAAWARQISQCLAKIFEANKGKFDINMIGYDESHCVRKLKKSTAEALVDQLKTCNGQCFRNMQSSYGGVWQQRGGDYHCPYRGEKLVCKRYVDLDHSPLICFTDRGETVKCLFHEQAFKTCPQKADGEPCYDLNEKHGLTEPDSDYLLVLTHRFHATSCLHCEEGGCHNPESPHYEGVCALHGLMAPCEHYAALPPDKAYTEGVCTYVSSMDGKDDRKIFPSSDYAYRIDDDERFTLCMACRISHSIARATGLKCLGVRRSASKPFLNDTNPLAKNTIEIDYLYLTHPEDVARYNPELIAQAVYDALHTTCDGLGCDEIDVCNFNID